MNRRVWAVVALFAGVAVMVAVWMAMSTDPTTTTPGPKATPGSLSAKGPKQGKLVGKPELRRVEIDPATLRSRLTPSAALGRKPVKLPGPPRGAAAAPQGPVAIPNADGVFPLDQDGVKAAIDERMEDLEGCYETALFHTPGLSGTMTLVMDVEPVQGKNFANVAGVDAESNLDATVFEGCVATVFEELKFAASEPTKLRYPIEFDPGDAAPSRGEDDVP